ncbi:hypothetical protein BDV93DRAFT_306033 [Ceratobasidium sp. AG-I]|nr:hypothetical protein BDV93DRAFT_306033 [Ceratobasidium sp. AG-I]
MSQPASPDHLQRFVGHYKELKSALCTRDNELSALQNELAALKNEVATLRTVKNNFDLTSPLLLCLIDGDGCIFNENLLVRGTEGGREAASKLRQHIVTHHGTNTDILVHVFFNRDGLGKTLKTYLNIQPETFSAFIDGFNTASPFISMLDVGVGKEAADTKIRELMRMFVRYPHVKKVYFGGGHDNGYATHINMIQNEGYLDKIILLQSYTQLAAEIKALGLPCLGNNGIFLSERIPTKSMNSGARGANGVAPVTNQSKSGHRDAPRTVVLQPTVISTSEPEQEPCLIVGGAENMRAAINVLTVLKPAPCIHYLLAKKGCLVRPTCPYGHAYLFTPEMLAYFRCLVKRGPCIFLTRGQECTDPECPSAHLCPRGSNCEERKQGICKFTAPGMHRLAISSHEDNHALIPRRPQYLTHHARTGSSSSRNLTAHRLSHRQSLLPK